MLNGKMPEECKNGELKVVQLLLERLNSEESGTKIKDRYGRTAIMRACYHGHKDVVQSLLNHSERIDLNASDIVGHTAFMCACENGHKDVVELLLYHF